MPESNFFLEKYNLKPYDPDVAEPLVSSEQNYFLNKYKLHKYEEPTRIGDDDEDPLWADYGRMIMAGGAQIGAGIGWLANNFEWGQALQEAGTSAAESWMEGLSDNAKHALSVEFTKRDDGELWTQRKWNKAKLIAAQSLLGTIAGMGTGAVLTKGLSVLGMRTAATTAAGAAVQVPSKAAGAIGYGLGEAAIAAPSVGAAIEAEIEGMDHETLLEQSPEYRAILDGLGSRGNEEDRRRQAKQLLADAAARKGSAMALVSTFVLSAPFGVLARSLAGNIPLATTRIRSIGVGAGAEAGQEFLQSGAEKMAENIAMRAADPDRPIFKGALEEAVGGALAGGMMGGVVGTVSPLEDPNALTPKDSPEVQLQTERDALDVEVVAAQEQLDKDDLDLELQAGFDAMLDDIELERQETAVGRVDKVERVEQMLDMEFERDQQLARQKEAQIRGMEEQRQLQEAEIEGEAEPRRGAVLPTLREPMHKAFIEAKGTKRDEEIARLMKLSEEPSGPSGPPPIGSAPIVPAPGPSEQAEALDEERAVIAREEAPETGSIEYRLQSEDTRTALTAMTDEIGMGERTGALIVKPRELTGEPGTKIYGTGEIGDEAERLDEGYTRLKSTNPKWFQQLGTTQGLKMNTRQVRVAVEKALAGKNLGKRQRLVIEHMLDYIEAENEGFYGKKAREFSQQEADEITVTQFEEGIRRKISPSLIAKAETIDESATEAALESATDAQAIQRLKDIVTQQSEEQIEEIANEAATSPENDIPLPTEAQKKAGNYKKGHLTIEGLPITIENPEGSVRFKNQKLKDHYGYIKRTEDADGDQIDVFVNPDSEGDFSGSVFVVDQLTEDGKSFDEHKVMLGYNSRAEATAAYKRNYEKGWKVGPVTELSMEEFKTWIAGDTTGPLAIETPKAEEKPKSEEDELEDLVKGIQERHGLAALEVGINNEGWIEVTNLEVSEDQQGKGKGSAAMQELIDYADKKGKTIILEPALSETDLAPKEGLDRFYKRLGFEPDTLIPGFYIREPKETDLLGGETEAIERQIEVEKAKAAKPQKEVEITEGQEDNLFTRAEGQQDLVEQANRAEILYDLAEELDGLIDKYGANPTTDQQNELTAAIGQLKRNKHFRADELMQKMKTVQSKETVEKPKGLTLGTKTKILRQSVSALAKEDKLTLQAYAIRLGLSEEGTKIELAQRIKDAVVPIKPSRAIQAEDVVNAPNQRWVNKLLGPESESDALKRQETEVEIKEIKTNREREKAGRLVKPTHARFGSIVNWMNKIIPGAKITALRNYKSLDPILRIRIYDADMTGLAGLTIGGDVYVFYDNIMTEGQLIETGLHEITHKGLAALFGKNLNPLLQDLYNNVPEKYKKKMAQIVKTYGFDITTEQGQLDAAEELIAIMAQSDPKAPFLKKFVVKIRQLLIKMGINIEWTDTDIHSLIAEAQDKLGRQRVKTADDVSLIEDIEISETGEIFTIETNGKEVLSQHDKRAAMIEKIQNCL